MSKENSEAINPSLKMALELGPIILFVIAYNYGDRIVPMLGLSGILEKPIFFATAVIMVATAIAITLSMILTRTIPVMPVVTLVVVSVFGALTFYFQDETFIKMKPTIINTLFGSALLIGLAFDKSFLKTVMGMAFPIDDEGWKILTKRWALFFLFLAIVNEIVWRNFSEGFWVGFKFWGMTGLSLIFVMSQMPLITKHSTEESEDA